MPVDLKALVDPAHSALILQELQRGVVGDETTLPALADAARQVGVVEHVAAVADAARRVGVRVVHCTAETLGGGFGANRNGRLFIGTLRAGATNVPGSSSVQPMAELGPGPDDVVVPRYHGLSPMTGSPLDSLLRNQGVTTVIVAGVSLNVAIPNLVFDAINRSYQVVVVSDGVAGTPVEYGEQVLRHALAYVATLASSYELVAAWDATAG